MKQTVRIPRYLAADWQRLRDHVAAQRAALGDPQPVNDATVLAVAVAVAGVAMKVPGCTGIVTEEGMPYEAPPEDPPEMPEFIHDLQARIERLERAAFWRNLEENPPKDGVPILPSPEWLEEARERFPDLYGPEASDD